METPANFTLAVVRMHRWTPGCSHYSLGDTLYGDEVDFFRSNEESTAMTKEDLLLCGGLLIKSLRTTQSAPTIARPTTGRNSNYDIDLEDCGDDVDGGDDDDEEEEIFNREIDAVEFRDWTHATSPGIIGGAATAARSSREDDGIFFHLPKDHPKFLTMQGVGVPDPKCKRTFYVQQEVCFLILLSNVPFQAYLKEKLQDVAHDFFFAQCNSGDLSTSLLLVDTFYKSLASSMDFAVLPYREIHVGLPVVNIVKWLGKDVIAVLRVLLLEGRVMCYSSNPALASSATLALLALLPGVLSSHSTEFTSRTIQAVLYRLRRFGMPFSLFNEDFILQPCFTKDQVVPVYATSGFVVGTSDPLLAKQPNAQLDLIVDLDKRHLVTYATMKTEYAFAFGAATAAFGDSLAERFGRNLGSASAIAEPTASGDRTANNSTSSRSRTLSGKLSRIRLMRRKSIRKVATATQPMQSDVEWILAQFQAYFEHFLEEGYKGVFNPSTTTSDTTLPSSTGTGTGGGSIAHTGANGYDPYNPSIKSRLEDLAAPVLSEYASFYANYGRAWTHAWQKTSNFENWLSVNRFERRRSTIIPPTLPPPMEGRASYTYPNGDEYEGEFQNGKRHGFGIYVEFMTKNQYEGDWRNDRRHGKGILSSKQNGYIYDGEWQDDVRCGRGHSLLKNVENYAGEWDANHFHGMGVYSNADGDIYDGEWNCGVKQGMGKLTIVRGKPEDEFGGLKQYVGEWHCGRFHCTGTAQYMDGTQYSGSFKDGKRHGNGVLLLGNGDKYDGQWWKGYRHGEGSYFSTKSGTTKEGTWKKDSEVDGMWFLVYLNGDKFTGQCKRGRPWGQGICKYANGSSYSGEWVDGLREGAGVLVNADGSILEGEWTNSVFARAVRTPSKFVDVQLSSPSSPSPRRGSISTTSGVAKSIVLPRHGSHVFVYPNGDQYEGEFVNSQRQGFGVFTERATGSVYEGAWSRDMRHGSGMLTSGVKDFVYDGKWENDVRTGYGHCVIRGCETYSGHWRANQFNGTGKYIDAEGDVYEGEFADGKKHGMGKQVFTQRKEEYSGEWRHGQRGGIGDAVFADGSTYSGGWKSDVLEGEGIYTSANGDKYTGQWRNGVREGSGVVHHPATGITKEGTWVADEPIDGEWTIIFPDGSKFTGDCIHGRPHGRGVCKYVGGDLYDGQWVDGNRQGHGIGFFANGDSFVGDWENNHVALNGNGKLTLADGTVHVYAN